MPRGTVDYLSPMRKLWLTLLALMLVVATGNGGFVSLVGIKHAGKKLTIGPSSDTTFKEEDNIVLIGETSNLERLSRDLIS